MSRLRGEFQEVISSQFQGREAAFLLSDHPKLIDCLTLEFYQQQAPQDQHWLATIAEARLKQQVKKNAYPNEQALQLRHILQQFVLSLQDEEDESQLYPVVAASQLLTWFNKEGECVIPENFLKPGVSVNVIWHDYSFFGFDSRDELLLSDHPVVMQHLVRQQLCQYQFLDQAAIARAAYLRLSRQIKHDSLEVRTDLKAIIDDFCHYYPDEEEAKRYHQLLFQLDQQCCIDTFARNWVEALEQCQFQPGFYADSLFDCELTMERYLRHSPQVQEMIARAVCYRLTQARYGSQKYSNEQLQVYLALLQAVDVDHELLTWFDGQGFNPWPEHWVQQGDIEAIWQRLRLYEFGGSWLSLYQSSHPLVLCFLTPEYIDGAYHGRVVEAVCWLLADPGFRQHNPKLCKQLYGSLSEVYQYHGIEMPLLDRDINFKLNAAGESDLLLVSETVPEYLTLERYIGASSQAQLCIDVRVLERMLYFIYVDEQSLKQVQLREYLEILRMALCSTYHRPPEMTASMRFVAELFNAENRYDICALAIDEIEFCKSINILDKDVSIFDLLKLPVTEAVYLQGGHKTQLALGDQALKILAPYVQQQHAQMTTYDLPIKHAIVNDAAMLKRILLLHYHDIWWTRYSDDEASVQCLEVLKLLDEEGCYDSRFEMYRNVVMQCYLGDKDNFYIDQASTPWRFNGPRTIQSSITRDNFLAGSYRRRHMFMMAGVCLLENRINDDKVSAASVQLLHMLLAAIDDPNWCNEYPSELLERIEELLQHKNFAHALVPIYIKKLQCVDVSDEACCVLAAKIIQFAACNEEAYNFYMQHTLQLVQLFVTNYNEPLDVQIRNRRIIAIGLYEFLKFDSWNKYPILCDTINALISSPVSRQLVIRGKSYLDQKQLFLTIPFEQKFYYIKCKIVERILTELEQGGFFVNVQQVFSILNRLLLNFIDYYLLHNTPLPKGLVKRIDRVKKNCLCASEVGAEIVHLNKYHTPDVSRVPPYRLFDGSELFEQKAVRQRVYDSVCSELRF